MPKPLLAILLVFVSGTRLSAAPLAVRVWQLQDYNMDHIKRLLDMAAARNVNRVQLSHNIVMDVEQPLSDERLVKDINTICTWAGARGIKVDVWTHELNGIPKDLFKDGKVDLDAPKLWEFVSGKYDRFFRLCPAVDGLVLTMQETAQSIYHDNKVASSLGPEKRVAKLIDDMAAVCKRFGKDLFVRTFSYEPSELQYILGGLAACKSDVIVMSKCVPHDWQPYYPYNPAIGNVGGKRQIVEFDLGHEFTGLSTIPYICLDYVKRHLDYDVSRGAVGAVFRVERLKWRAVDTPNQAVIDVSTRLLLDPSADPRELYREWLAERYSREAVPYLYSAFTRTPEILEKGLFVLGFWVTNHSRLPSYDYAKRSLHGRTTAKWDPSTQPIEQILHHPTAETIGKIAAEKDEALRLADASIADVESARPHLSESQYASLIDLFRRERAMVIVWKAAMEVIFGIDVVRSGKSQTDRKALLDAADRLERLAAANREHLVKMAADYSVPDRTDNVDEARRLVDLARKVVGEK